HHPSRGLLLPEHFLAEVENDELGLRLGDWVLQGAIAQLAHWQAQGLDLTLSVNIAAHHLHQTDFIDRLQALLQQAPPIRPGRLELEVLEANALNDRERVAELIHRCDDLGVGFALDDFGTGYSSLAYLKHLSAQALKIDRGFVGKMLEDAEQLAIVDSVLCLARAFRRRPIAEGVETREQGQMLLSLGCELAQ
ncbi:MAG: EAL domain-containing protein, partial [Gammaproteobacteria bacterium SHHR-1]